MEDLKELRPLNPIKKFFTLKIHGSELISAGTDQWMLASKIAIFLMALAESLSWAYFGSLLSSNNFTYIAAGLTGITVFAIVWSLDKSLITLDRYKRHYHEKTYLTDKEEGDESKENMRNFWKENETKFGVGIRTLIVVASMYFTAPYLTQLYFDKDIKIAIDKFTEQAISQRRLVIEAKYDTLGNGINEDIRALKSGRILEIAGKGPSGQIGDDATAKEYLNQISQKEKELDKTDSLRNNELSEYDTATSRKAYKELGEKWGVNIPQNSMETRSKVIEPITSSSEGSKASLTIRGFLAFLFLALIILKFFEPRSVRIYLSEALQQHYQSYKKGGFDYLINSEERINGKSPMSPFRFEEFMLVHYYEYITKLKGDDSIHRYEEMLRQLQDNIIQIEEEKIKLETRDKEKIESLKKELKKNDEESGNLRHKIDTAQNLKTSIDAELIKIDAEIKELEIFIESNPAGSHGRKTAEGHYVEIQNLQKQKHDNFEELQKCNSTINENQFLLTRLSIARKDLEANLNKIEAPLEELDKKIKEWVNKKIELIEFRLNELINQHKNNNKL